MSTHYWIEFRVEMLPRVVKRSTKVLKEKKSGTFIFLEDRPNSRCGVSIGEKNKASEMSLTYYASFSFCNAKTIATRRCTGSVSTQRHRLSHGQASNRQISVSRLEPPKLRNGRRNHVITAYGVLYKYTQMRAWCPDNCGGRGEDGCESVREGPGSACDWSA